MPEGSNYQPRSVSSRQWTEATSFVPITSDSTVFTVASGEVGFIQNIQNTALYVKYGESASSTSFSVILKAGSAANDGNGGSIYIDNWVGPVSVAAASGSPRVIAWKLT